MTSFQDEPKGWHSRGYLPHFDSPMVLQHIVFRTHASLPPGALDLLPSDPAERRSAVDRLLDQSKSGRDLANPLFAQIVEDALLYFDGHRYALLAWCIMPNHVHVLMMPDGSRGIGEIVQSWKRFTAKRINQLRGTYGSFWAPDYFDRYVRNEAHREKTIWYIEMNPAKAGLVNDPSDWPFSSARRRRAQSDR